LPIVRRLPDGAPLNLNLSPHRCPTPGSEEDYQAAEEAGMALGCWPWYPAQRRRREEAEARERDLEAALYADWVAFRRANGIPDSSEGGWLPDREARP
jgi:hypothetical protein